MNQTSTIRNLLVLFIFCMSAAVSCTDDSGTEPRDKSEESGLKAPALIQPEARAYDVPLDTGFEWEDSNTDGTRKYDLAISLDNEQWTVLASGLTANSFMPAEELVNGQKYFWKVTVSDDLSRVKDSQTGVFYTYDPSAAAFEPSPVFPAVDQDKVDPYTLTFKWSYPVDDPWVQYTFHISEDNQNWTDVELESTDTEYTPATPLSLSTEYYWKVTAKSRRGYTETSEVRKMKTSKLYTKTSVITYKENTVAGMKPVHIIIMGDGFITQDFTENGVFEQWAARTAEQFLAPEPFNTYRDYFRISFVTAYNNTTQRGVNVENKLATEPFTEPKTMTTATLFGTSIKGGVDRTINMSALGQSNVEMYASFVDHTLEMKDATFIILVNEDASAGCCHMSQNGKSVSLFAQRLSEIGGVEHEAGGHGFARILDEYRELQGGNPTSLPTSTKMSIATWRGSSMSAFYNQDPWAWGANPYHYAANIDMTNNENLVHWKHFMTKPDKYPGVGLYEGANYYALSVWRPENVSLMNNAETRYFNAPSREAVVRRIMSITGQVFDLEDFYAKDVHNPPVFNRASARSGTYDARPPYAAKYHQPPILLPE